MSAKEWQKLAIYRYIKPIFMLQKSRFPYLFLYYNLLDYWQPFYLLSMGVILVKVRENGRKQLAGTGVIAKVISGRAVVLRINFYFCLVYQLINVVKHSFVYGRC